MSTTLEVPVIRKIFHRAAGIPEDKKRGLPIGKPVFEQVQDFYDGLLESWISLFKKDPSEAEGEEEEGTDAPVVVDTRPPLMMLESFKRHLILKDPELAELMSDKDASKFMSVTEHHIQTVANYAVEYLGGADEIEVVAPSHWKKAMDKHFN
jgi:hypothetical protein